MDHRPARQALRRRRRLATGQSVGVGAATKTKCAYAKGSSFRRRARLCRGSSLRILLTAGGSASRWASSKKIASARLVRRRLAPVRLARSRCARFLGAVEVRAGQVGVAEHNRSARTPSAWGGTHASLTAGSRRQRGSGRGGPGCRGRLGIGVAQFLGVDVVPAAAGQLGPVGRGCETAVGDPDQSAQ